MIRLLHDGCHRIAVRMVGLVSSLLRGEEAQEFYREAMAILKEEIGRLVIKKRRQADRLGLPESPL
jgi:hypothetical protein